jgi:Ca-activated chloride channel family protein
VSFATPLVLLGLLALPLVVLAYLAHERDRRTAAAAFATPKLQPSVAARRPGWRRHAPMLAFGLALVVLVIAAAKPQHTVAIPVEKASIMLATDVSGSMLATDVQPSRLAAAKNAAKRFVASVPGRVNVGVMAFNQTPTVLQSPTTDRSAVNDALDRMRSSGATATGEAIATATRILRGNPLPGQARIPAAIVLLSDGTSTRGRAPVPLAQAAGKLHIPVYTVALGTDQGTITVHKAGGGTTTQRVPPSPAALAEIARASGGKAFTAETAGGLKQVYEKLGSQLGHRRVKRQLTSTVAGGGLLLLLAGAAMSLGWFGRLV